MPDIEEILEEIKELARFHSVDVPCVYYDGTKSIDKMISLEELNRILYEVGHPETDEKTDD